MEEDDIELTSSLLEDVIITKPVHNERKKHKIGYLRKSLSSSLVVFIIAVVLLGVTIGTNFAIISSRKSEESNTTTKDLEIPANINIYTGPAIVPNIALPIRDE